MTASPAVRGRQSIRVLVSADMEGVAGIVTYEDVAPGDARSYQEGRELLTGEVNAAIRGVLAYDDDADVLVAEAHAQAHNVLPAKLERAARLLRGFPKPDGMLTGIGEHLDAVILLGCHGKAGTPDSVMAHTAIGAIQDVRCDGRSLGEIGINIAYAAHFGTPTVLVVGDDTAVAEARKVAPAVRTVEVKRALGQMAADSLHPEVACGQIEQAVPPALDARAEIEPLRLGSPVELEMDFKLPRMVEPVLLIPGTERNGALGVRYVAADVAAVYRFIELVGLLRLTP